MYLQSDCNISSIYNIKLSYNFIQEINIMYSVLINVQHTVHKFSTGLLTTNNKIVMFVKSLIMYLSIWLWLKMALSSAHNWEILIL